MRTVVIGVGNRYRRDDGVGPVVVDLLRAHGVDGVESLGETASLIELWDGADLAILVDAVRGDTPGRRHRLALPASRAAAASSHGLDLGEAIELARVLDRLPARLVLHAVEVADVGLGEGLSPAVAAAAKRLAADILAGEFLTEAT
jgi:hydrogenase maturation protease